MRRGVPLAWTAGLAGALGLGLACWRLAPGASDDLRLILAVGPLLLWAGAVLVGGVLTAPSPLRPSSPQAGSSPARADTSSLAEALRLHGLSGRRERYGVPLFLVLGPSGMGKSNLLRRAGLELAPPQDENGMVWWLGREAIFVEAATGRVDAVRLADALAHFRPARPVDGVILAVSPADLTLADALERKEIGEALGEALSLIEARASVRPPVYLALTKMDLAPGFSESFDFLEAAERDQLWGFSFPPSFAQSANVEEAVEAFHAGIHNLVEAARARLMEALSQIDEPLRGGRLLNFGAQIASLDPIVDSVLKEILPGVRERGKGVFLRGVFFTSAEQDALTIDGLLPEMAARFAMPRSGMLPPDLGAEDAEQGFFIKGMIRQAVLPEAGLAIGPATPWHRRRSFGAGLVLTAMAAVVLGCVGLQSAFEVGQQRLALFEMALAKTDGGLLRSRADDVAVLGSVALALDELQGMRVGGATSGPWQPLLGGDRLSRALSDGYWRGLRNSLLPHLVARLSADLVDRDALPAALADRVVAADPRAPRHGPALASWIAATAAKVDGESARRALLSQAPRAFALSDAEAPSAGYIDAARRLIAAKETAR